MISLRHVNATRYVIPLREGGSLPALAEADDGFKYVIKFRGAGHGTKALISELIGGCVAKILNLPVPELVFVQIDEAFGRTEGDEEIQDLLKASQGLNLGLHFLSGALPFDGTLANISGQLASEIVWLDAFLTNIDRTIRNVNMLFWHREVWLIDFGASLYFHHTWIHWEKHARGNFPQIKDHVLLPFADQLNEVDKRFKAILSDQHINEIVELIPTDWLLWKDENSSFDNIKTIYRQFLTERRNHSETFVKEAQDARNALI